MIDIHCHILPGIDDGADSLETSCAMADMAIEDGVTHIIGTPHSNSVYRFSLDVNKQRRDELQARYEGRLNFATGCDFHLSFENLEEIRNDSWRFTLNQKNYLLVEFADYSIPGSLDQSLHNLQLAGLRPIITHPERNPLIRTQPERLLRWLNQGCFVQITAQSIAGRFGEVAQEAAAKWLAAGAVHFIASDAHNLTSRPLRLKHIFEHVSENYGENVARALLIENPRAAFEGLPLPHVPDVCHEEAINGPAPRKKRLWFFGHRQ